ncbi:MAG: alpha/beta hydrolase [Nitrospinae bacterium]|nr:alpha/beta hydrolase [Nitrospinota bacterium]MBL7020101.1 alpha/beta hydrolase [Nitrospinaceae bacterium]
MTEFIYLHGFASGPGSQKACIFKDCFEKARLSLTIPDLQQGDFENLTLTKQISLVQGIIDGKPGADFALIGSSMGAYIAALIAETRKEIKALYLMAPGFNFLNRWMENMGWDNNSLTSIPDLIRVFHYSYNREVNLNTNLFRDAVGWDSLLLTRNIPIRIVHGLHDETVNIQESRDFAILRPWCQLKELDSDHGLLSCIDGIVEDCIEFFRLKNLINDKNNSFL